MGEKSRYVKWTIDWATGILKATFKMIVGEKESTFDIKVIFPEFASMTEIQKHCILTGLKPKLEDVNAAEAAKALTASERYLNVGKMWKQLTEEKIWSRKATGERETPQKKLDAMSAEEKAAMTPDQVELLKKLGFKI